ncbi:MAG: hypothetical protein JSS86_06560 [Cyanobacteria bacterium SZAS LIN-2]|nr:hypothetical protein [Cyanobacteria bacterium SZAS LIN-2]
MKSKRLSVDIGVFTRDAEPVDVWNPAPASKRNTADMLAEYSAGVLIKGYRAYLRGDYVDSRRFEQFIERGRDKKEILCQQSDDASQDYSQKVSRLRRMESRYQWALTIRENVSHFILNVTGLKGNCRLRKVPVRPHPRSSRHAAQGARQHAGVGA